MTANEGEVNDRALTRSSFAVLGARPAFDLPLHVGRPNIGNRHRLRERLDDILDRRWLTNGGPYVEEFERRIAEVSEVRNALAMCNATVALEILVRALNLSGEVIIPSFTFVATAHALQWQQITPVFCDVDPNTHNIDPKRVEALITPRTSGIIGVHVWGRPCDTAALEEIARRRGLCLLFDAAHAFGCSSNGRMLGGFGSAEVFSFHATKFINAGEGGAVVTNDDELAARMRLMRNFGFANYDRVDYVGTNGKMSEMAAAMGLTSLDSMSEIIAANKVNYEAYRNGLHSVPGFRLIDYDIRHKPNFQYVVVEIDERVTGLSRDELYQVLHAENVLARKYFYPGCHQMEPYRSHFPHAGLLLPATNELTTRVLSLPTGTAVGVPDIELICAIIRSAVNDAHVLRNALFDSTREASRHDQ